MRFVLVFLAIPYFCMSQTTHIHIDQFGYYADASKVAIFADPVEGFNASESFEPGEEIEVRRVSSDEVVFSGNLAQWNNGDVDNFSGDKGWHFDFTELDTPGEYYIYDSTTGMKSPSFIINDGPYNKILVAACKMFYYNRCGIEKIEPYADSRWVDAVSFNQDRKARYIYEQENEGLERDLWGGWFDAGDYNKYVTFNYSVIHNLLSAYENNPEIFGDDWGIPESDNQVPDILDEVKWELDWMKKMANNDGSVHIKMGSMNHNDNSNSPPSNNGETRFYGPICSAASATLASNFAHAALIFNTQYNLELYAEELVGIAGVAFDYALAKLDNNELDTSCDDGSIVAGDADLNEEAQAEAMMSAAIYLFDFTGFEKYNEFIKKHIESLEPINSDWWGPYKLPLQDALLRYSELNNADLTVASLISHSAEAAVSSNVNDFYGSNDLTLYRDYMPDWSYHWGSNNIKAGYANLNGLMARYGIGDDTDNQAVKIEAMMHSFHGVNPLGLVYLSNMYEYGATKSINEVYHLWFADQSKYDNALDSEIGPAPGYVSGGPNKDFSVSTISPPYNQPPTKSYLDYNTGWPDNSWEISEPAIYYQASYIRMISEVIGRGGIGSVDVEDETEALLSVSLVPNPATSVFQVNIKTSQSFTVKIVNADGKLVFEKDNVYSNEMINLKSLNAGIYFVKIDNSEHKITKKLILR